MPQKIQPQPSLFVPWTLKQKKTQIISMALAILSDHFEKNKGFIQYLNFLGQIQFTTELSGTFLIVYFVLLYKIICSWSRHNK